MHGGWGYRRKVSALTLGQQLLPVQIQDVTGLLRKGLLRKGPMSGLSRRSLGERRRRRLRGSGSHGRHCQGCDGYDGCDGCDYPEEEEWGDNCWTQSHYVFDPIAT